MDKNISRRRARRLGAAIVASIGLALSSLATGGLPTAGAYPGYGEYDYQVPFRCGETWYGHTYQSMTIGGVTLQGHGRGNNLAIDFNRVNDYGASVLASASGYAYTYWNPSGLGNYVVIDHGGGFQTVYAHLAAVWVRSGQFVGQGTVIGAVGSTGNSSGPHLHYEQRYNGISQQLRFRGYYFPVIYGINTRASVTSANSC